MVKEEQYQSCFSKDTENLQQAKPTGKKFLDPKQRIQIASRYARVQLPGVCVMCLFWNLRDFQGSSTLSCKWRWGEIIRNFE